MFPLWKKDMSLKWVAKIINFPNCGCSCEFGGNDSECGGGCGGGGTS